MAISRRTDYVDKEVLLFDDLNRWSINGSPQFLTQTTMAAVATQPFEGVFNLFPDTAYKNFKIIISNFRTSVAGLVLNMKFMSGAAVSGSTYDQAYQQVSTVGGITYYGGTGLAALTIIRNSNVTNHYAAMIDVFNPNVNGIATGISKISGSGNDYSTSSGKIINSAPFDGFQLSLSAAGTMRGVVSVYALRSGNA